MINFQILGNAFEMISFEIFFFQFVTLPRSPLFQSFSRSICFPLNFRPRRSCFYLSLLVAIAPNSPAILLPADGVGVRDRISICRVGTLEILLKSHTSYASSRNWKISHPFVQREWAQYVSLKIENCVSKGERYERCFHPN